MKGLRKYTPHEARHAAEILLDLHDKPISGPIAAARAANAIRFLADEVERLTTERSALTDEGLIRAIDHFRATEPRRNGVR